MSDVAIVRIADYTQEAVDEAVEKACTSCAFPAVQGKRVLLKPNILSDAPVQKAITTNPAVVKAMIHFLRKLGAGSIVMGDSSGLQTSSGAPKLCAMADVCKEEGIEWIDFTESPVVKEVPYTRGIKVPLARIVVSVDVIITLPKFKTHQLMYATGAMKNQFGLIPSLHKSACHVKCTSRTSFADLIVGINALAKPAFALMDGIIGMEGAGPANGNPRHIGLLLASSDLLSLDTAEATIMGYNPTDIPIIASAIRHRYGTMPSYPLLSAEECAIPNFETVKIEKETHLVRNLILPFFTRPFASHHQRVNRPAPVFSSTACILCRRCVEICPAKALTVKDKKVVIDTHSCVRCYCCHEVCPRNAITIEENKKGS